MNFLTSSEKIEKRFEKYFQKVAVIRIRDEIIKKGKFLLIKNCILGNNYFYEFILEKARKQDIFKIPYPFGVEEYPDENLIYLDYRFTTLCNNNPELVETVETWVSSLDLKTPSKLIDSILEIKFE